MALVVEDGSGVAGANTYADLATIEAYFTERGDTTFAAASTEAKEGAILRAMGYIETHRWRGQRVSITQSLAWPRVGCKTRDFLEVPSDVVPVSVVYALAEASKRELTTPGTMLPDVVRGTGQLRRDKTDVLETEWFKQDKTELLVPFPAVTRFLLDYIVDPASDTSRTFNIISLERV